MNFGVIFETIGLDKPAKKGLRILSFQNYKAKDSGTYTCNIKNEAGEANVELTLNIEGSFYLKLESGVF